MGEFNKPRQTSLHKVPLFGCFTFSGVKVIALSTVAVRNRCGFSLLQKSDFVSRVYELFDWIFLETSTISPL